MHSHDRHPAGPADRRNERRFFDEAQLSVFTTGQAGHSAGRRFAV